MFDEQRQQCNSDAEVDADVDVEVEVEVEVEVTAFTSKPKAQHITARLIVRRVRDQNPDHLVANDQGELFPAWPHHAVFTNSPLVTLQAEADHRRHAIIEQVIADLKNSALATCPAETSPPTPPGWCSPRWRSTSPTPLAPSPPDLTQGRPRPRSAGS